MRSGVSGHKALRLALFALACLLGQAASAYAQMATGTYTGDGVAGRALTIGFQPDIVIIKADDGSISTPTEGVIRTSTMTGTKGAWGFADLQPGYITALTATGFTIGNDIRVNGLNACKLGAEPCVYHWIALKADSDIKVGTYVGDGNATQPITGVGFSPGYVMTMAEGSHYVYNRTSEGTVESGRLRNGGTPNNGIPSLDVHGFTVGNLGDVRENQNENTVTYHYIALNDVPGKIKVGGYNGAGSAQNVTGVGFQPEFVMTQSWTDSKEVNFKSDKMEPAEAMDFAGAVLTGRITAILADGFAVTTDSRVGASGESYGYVALNIDQSSTCWDASYAHRQQFTVLAGSVAVPSEYTQSLTFDHAALVTGGKSLASGDDLRVVYWNGVSWEELHRILAPASSWNSATTTILFKLPVGIAASSSDGNYYLHYGNPGATNPPSDPAHVYLHSDGYESGDYSGWTGDTAGPGDTNTIVTGPSPVHSGTYASESFVDADAVQSDWAFVDEFFDGKPGVHSTIWVYIPTGYSAEEDMTVLHTYTGGWTAKVASIAIRAPLGDMRPLLHLHPPAPDEFYFGTGTALALDTWHKLELKVWVDPVNGRVEVWQNDTKTIDLSNVDTGSGLIDHTIHNVFFKSVGAVLTDTLYFDDSLDQVWLDGTDPTVTLGTESTGCDCSYEFTKKLTIDHTKVGLDNVGSLPASFPVLVDLTANYLKTSANGGDIQDPNGFDIIFLDSDQSTPLDHEIEKYDGATGHLVAWVAVPSLSKATDRDIYLSYSNACISASQENVANIWTGWEGVWHLHDDFLDSTVNNNDGTTAGTTDITGKAADGEDFDGGTDNIDFTNNSLNTAQVFTVSAWVKRTSTGSAQSILNKFTSTHYSWKLSFEPTDAIRLDIVDVGLGNNNVVGDTVTDSEWHYIVGRSDGAELRVFLDGNKHANATPVSVTINYDGSDLFAGVQQWASATSDYLNGSLDEIRVAGAGLSDDWIVTEYYNQISPSSFFTVSECPDLAVVDGGNTITVTAPNAFEMTFDTVAGGAIRTFYDLSEDPTKQTDLAGDLNTVQGLHNSGVRESSTNYNTTKNSTGRLDLLEATSTRVKVRQEVFYESNAGVILAGLKNVGDYSIYPAGRLALRTERRTTTAFTYETEYHEFVAHYLAVAPLDTWATSSDTDDIPSNPGTDTFLLHQNDVVGARTDFLDIIYQDWILGNGYLGDADITGWGTNGPGERLNAYWDDLTLTPLPADRRDVWNFLTYFKPVNLGRTPNPWQDPEVTGRRDDYRPTGACPTCGPDDLASPSAPAQGGGWFHPSENTSSPSDFFNESEAAYSLEFDMSSGLEFDIDGGTGTPPTRYSPFLKIRQWRSFQDPETVTLEGATLTNDVDFKADVKPISDADYQPWDNDILYHSTLESIGAIGAADIGDGAPVTSGGPVGFVNARYGQGVSFNSTSDYVDIQMIGSDALPNIELDVGRIEFWYKPNYDHDDNVQHYILHVDADGNDVTGPWIRIKKESDVSSVGKPNWLNIWIADNTGTYQGIEIRDTGYSWRAGDWVHMAISWDSADPTDTVKFYMNGENVPPDAIRNNTFTMGPETASGVIRLGNSLATLFNADGIIDELTILDMEDPRQLAKGGLTSSPDEYLASTTNNQDLNFEPVDVSRRGKFLSLGSDAQFRGLNIGLATAGIGTVDLQWEYWDGTTGAWADLETLTTNFTDETASLTKSNGTVYWESDPPGWAPYSVNGGPEVYYVRAYLASGSYTTDPVEALIKTDILLFQYCGEITQASQTFNFAVPLATAVELMTFEARPLDGAVDLEWKTGSEIDNLGFHLYRSTAADGPYERLTSSVIPGLGSSPQGATYRYRDSGLTNEVTYFYKLEDIETTGKTELHGPVSATPTAEVVAEGDPDGEEESIGGGTTEGISPDEYDVGDVTSSITYGDPSANELKVRRRGKRWMELTLITEGFYAIPQEDGSVLLEVPGFEDFGGPDLPDVPAYRTWQDVLAGRNVRMASVKVGGVAEFASLRPSSSELIVVASGDGTVQTGRRRKKRRQPRHIYYPESWAQLMNVGFQGPAKKALVEMAPLRWDATAGKLVLARRIVVRIAFKGKDKAELKLGKSHREVGSHANRSVYARIAVTEPGLYGVSYESVFGKRRKAIKTSSLRLSRQGEPVAFFVSPNSKKFKKKSVLYFLSDGADLNPHGQEAVYELEASQQGLHMETLNASPAGGPTTFYWKTVKREENLLYQAAFEGEEDIWQWDWLFGPMTNGYPFEVTNLSPVAENSKLRVWLHGASDFPEDPDHHVRLYVNGTLLTETWWDGETPHFVEAELGPGLLQEGENTLEIEEVGDTEAQYSMVMLDRFEVSYPAQLVEELEGSFTETGVATIIGGAGHVFDVTQAQPRRLAGIQSGPSGLIFGVGSGHQYLMASEAKTPEVRPAQSTGLKKAWSRAEYLVIGPREFLAAAEPLLAYRRNEGLISGAIATEDIYDEFGYGEATPESIKDFLSYVYHHWSEPTLRYVVLLGDSTYDTKDYLATGVKSHVPVKTVETRYMWTASDPWYGAINGDDILPDVAIGRLPAASVEEVQSLVGKILAYETEEGDPGAPFVLVTDNPDIAGNFDADAEEIASTLLKEEGVEKIYLSQLGAAGAHGAIRNVFDEGASLVSYMGHGAIHLWAQENLLNIWDVDSLSPQAQQPFLLTMNCLNGYFHFPYHNSLSEELLKAEGKGVIAAFSPTGLSLNSPAHRFHKALLQEVVHANHERLGDAILAGQTGYAQTGAFPELLSIYHLLGDPALRLR